MPPKPKPSLLGLFWLGIQMVWGALLGVSLQARVSQLAPHQALGAYGALAAAGATVAAITQIGVGLISDRRREHGSRRIEFYAIGAVAAAGALFWFYGAPSYAGLFAAVMLVQISMNVAIGPYQAVIPDFVGQSELGPAASWMAALQSLGNAAGALVAGLVKDGRVVACALAATLIATCAASAAHVRRLTLLPAAHAQAGITRSFVDLFISRALVYVGFYTLLGYLYFYVAQASQGDTRMLTGVVLLIFTAAGAVGAAACARQVDRADCRAVASFGGAAFIAALVAFLLVRGFAAIGGAAFAAGAAWGVFLSADWALGCRFLPRFALATAMGIWNLALLIPQIVAPLAATAVLAGVHALQSSAAPRIAFALAGVEVLAGILWLWRLPPAYSSSV